MSNNVNWYELGKSDSLKNYCRDLTYFPKISLDEYTRGWIEGMVQKKGTMNVSNDKAVSQVR